MSQEEFETEEEKREMEEYLKMIEGTNFSMAKVNEAIKILQSSGFIIVPTKEEINLGLQSCYPKHYSRCVVYSMQSGYDEGLQESYLTNIMDKLQKMGIPFKQERTLIQLNYEA